MWDNLALDAPSVSPISVCAHHAAPVDRDLSSGPSATRGAARVSVIDSEGKEAKRKRGSAAELYSSVGDNGISSLA